MTDRKVDIWLLCEIFFSHFSSELDKAFDLIAQMDVVTGTRDYLLPGVKESALTTNHLTP